MRAALREESPYVLSTAAQGSYRAAPQRTASDTLARVVGAERARIGRLRALALAAVAMSGLGAGLLVPAQPAVMGLTILAAVLIGWRTLVNARRAASALDAVNAALPEVVATLSPPPIVPSSDAAQIAVRTSGGILAQLFAGGLGLILLILVATLTFATTERVPAREIGVIYGVHVMLFVLVLPLLVVLSRVDAVIDVGRGEVLFDHRILGIRHAQTIAPLEIVARFYVQEKRRGFDVLGVEVVEGEPVSLVEGDHAKDAALALNRALGRAPGVAQRGPSQR